MPLAELDCALKLKRLEWSGPVRSARTVQVEGHLAQVELTVCRGGERGGGFSCSTSFTSHIKSKLYICCHILHLFIFSSSFIGHSSTHSNLQLSLYSFFSTSALLARCLMLKRQNCASAGSVFDRGSCCFGYEHSTLGPPVSPSHLGALACCRHPSIPEKTRLSSHHCYVLPLSIHCYFNGNTVSLPHNMKDLKVRWYQTVVT